jgi:hypothetical protein
MNRTFTLLLALFITVTLTAQKSTVAEPQMPETFSSRLKQDILRKLDRPELLDSKGHVQNMQQKYDVKSGRPLSGIQDEVNPFPGLDVDQEFRSTLAAKKRLDSIVSDLKIEVYEYDENGNHLSTVVYSRDTITDPYMPEWKMEAAFDEKGYPTMEAEYHWVDSLMAWIGDWKDETTWDENGRITMTRSYEWEESESATKSTEAGGWLLIEEVTVAYNENGNETDLSVFGRDYETGDWVGTYTEHYDYDANGYYISSTSSSVWDPVASEFKQEYMMDVTRDENGRITEWVESKWEEDEVAKSESSASAGMWVFTFKGTSSYDANGNTLSTAWFDWDVDAMAWIGSVQYVYTYDEDENRTSYAFLYWNSDSSRWENWQIDVYSYDGSGNHVRTVSSNWDLINQKWVEMTKSDYTFNGDGYRLSTDTYNKDILTDEWMLSYSEVRTYNAMNYLTSSMTSSWNEDSAKMIVQSKQERTYNANGDMTSNVYYGWDYFLNMLTGYSRTDYTRDDDGNVLTSTEFLWDAILYDWLPDSRLEYTYDYGFTGFDLLAPFYMWAMITSYIEYSYQAPEMKSSEDWVRIDEYIYHWSDLEVSGLDDVLKGELSIYPNPATDYIQVEGDPGAHMSRILMYDVSGKIILNQVLDRGGRIPVGHLSQGIYVVRLVQGSKVKTGKIMIQ